MSGLVIPGFTEEPVIKKPRAVKAKKEVVPKEPPPVYETYEDFDPEKLFLYAGIDCVVTSELASALAGQASAEPECDFYEVDEKTQKTIHIRKPAMSIFESYEEFTKPALEFVVDLEVNGIQYNCERNFSVGKRMVEEVAELTDQIFSIVGKQFDINSGTAVAKLLYDELQMEVVHRTKTNEPAVDGDSLRDMVKNHNAPKWLDTLAKRNDINSTYNTFVKTYVEDFVKRDGRVHPSYNLHGTSSFRISGSEPNLTQLPNARHGYNVREFYEVENGMVFMCLDFSSAEVKILGALCRDPMLLKAIEEGKDFHSFSACNMYGLDYDTFVAVLDDEEHPDRKKFKAMRQNSKALTFGILYGSSAPGIAANLGITLDEAKRLIDLYFNNFPLIKNYVERAHAMAKANHYVVSPFGQRKAEFGTLPVFEKTAVFNAALRNSQNVLVQNTASSLGLYCFSQLNRALKKQFKGAKTLCTVYDSIEVSCRREDVAAVLELCYYYMDDYPLEVFEWLTLPVGADAEIGFDWGHCKHVKRGATQTEMEVILDKLAA